MTNKVYRSAMGRVVDMGALQLKNESVRAVGNMKVNARGDIVDPDNQPVKSRNKVVAKQYSQQTKSNVRDEGVQVTATPADPVQRQESAIKKAKGEAPPTGLAAAIARAKQNQDIDDNEDI